MSKFDDVLGKTVQTVEAAQLAQKLASVTIIRDLKGKVRLVVEFHGDTPPSWGADRDALAQQLEQELSPYWGGQIWRIGEHKDATYRALKDAIENSRQPWNSAPTDLGGALTWYRVERIFSKSSWIGQRVRPPWTLDNEDDPAIITFYSFKGGVGRTVTAAAVALLLARAGRNVVVLDLDMEAPGLGTLLLGSTPPPDDGIVDYLLETRLLGKRPDDLDLFAAIQNQAMLVGSGRPIRVFTAGQLDSSYLEKIARLDFEGFVNEEPNPLAELLDHIRQEYTPDFVLLDVRAGLHDLGGLSLNGLSHLDVLFGLNTEQSWAGLEIVLGVLGAADERREALLVHAMVTPRQYDEEANERFRERGFDLLHDHYYPEDEDMPDVEAPEAPYGLPIPFKFELLNVQDLERVVDSLTAPGEAYERLVQLIGAYVQRETL